MLSICCSPSLLFPLLPFSHSSFYLLTYPSHSYIHPCTNSSPTHSPIHLSFLIHSHTIHPSAHPHICPSSCPSTHSVINSDISSIFTSHPCMCWLGQLFVSHPSISCSTCLPTYPSICHPLIALLPSSSLLLLEGGKPLYCYSQFSALCLCGFSDKRLIHRRKGC